MFLSASASASSRVLDQSLAVRTVRRSEQMNPRFILHNASMISITRLGSEELQCRRDRD